MEYINNKNNAKIVWDMIDAIHENAAYLSEIDGETGDGDHGINMNKGFTLAKTKIPLKLDFSEALKILGKTLIMDIGGSMGPIYGTMFSRMSKTMRKHEQITAQVLLDSLDQAIEGLMDLAGAQLGDKTLLDTLSPAAESLRASLIASEGFDKNLMALSKGAEDGKENTKQLVAKIGRAARLGERSKGFLDAGATSCCILLVTMSNSMRKMI